MLDKNISILYLYDIQYDTIMNEIGVLKTVRRQTYDYERNNFLENRLWNNDIYLGFNAYHRRQ